MAGGAKPPRNVALWQVYAQVTEQKISSDMDKLIAKREKDKK